MKRLALIHTVMFLADLFKGKLADSYPELSYFHIVDESLIQDLMQNGEMTTGIVRRISSQALLAQEAGAELILFTCSSTSPAVDAARKLVDVPIIKIDDPMAEKAVLTGDRIGVVCTANTTMGPSENLIKSHAARLNKEVQVLMHLESAAFEAVMTGDKAKHDQLVRQAVTDIAAQCDVVVLAQASMAHLAPGLNSELEAAVLASPDLCVEALGAML